MPFLSNKPNFRQNSSDFIKVDLDYLRWFYSKIKSWRIIGFYETINAISSYTGGIGDVSLKLSCQRPLDGFILAEVDFAQLNKKIGKSAEWVWEPPGALSP